MLQDADFETISKIIHVLTMVPHQSIHNNINYKLMEKKFHLLDIKLRKSKFYL